MVIGYLSFHFITLSILLIRSIFLFVNRKKPIPAAGMFRAAVTTIFRWEKGTRIPDVVTLMHIAKALGIELTDLIPT